MRPPVLGVHHLRHIPALLRLGLLRRRRHRPPRSIPKPITGHILRAVHFKQPARHTSLLQHVLRSRLHRQRLWPRQVKAPRLILFPVEHCNRNNPARIRLAHRACPLQNRHRAHRGRLFLGVLDTARILRQARCDYAKPNRQHPRSTPRQRGIISSGCILNLLEGLSHASERQSSRLYSPD